MKSLLDRAFKYVPSTSTNLRETFARVRKEQAESKAATEQKVSRIKQAPRSQR